MAWEQCKIDHLIEKGGSGGTPSTSNKKFYEGKINFLSITDISNSDGYIFETEKHITEEALLSSSAWIVPKESISLAMYASVGKVAILKENTATSQAFYNMVIKNISVRDYLYQYFKKMEFNNEWAPLISTGTQSNLNAEKIKKLDLFIPKNDIEKRNIGYLFNYLDSLITLHQRKWKKSLEQRCTKDKFLFIFVYLIEIILIDN
ncbi:restriction endonuclease subunit S [Mycoplasmopsis sturni]|uniref:restriction endonuclease subunit S n=1 Tax=Mycoplasmopsis sturni TaxID=39047 RepID=UPI00068F3ABF|nr:restriction endonuclease subunit S [Mycoplasmopsis sturni]